ncbi:MAG: sensor histidine kinase KdpD [Acidimicrobiales bacterium]|nr:sensor histidine kinase KdpD [Acidimicrobiales bacterium]
MARGKLRIYLGAAPGVGKTFAMLNEGRRRRDRGTDVVVGYVETHGRPNTAAQLEDLEVVPRRTLGHRGTEFQEMDVDAVLARRPAVVLVDELAHTNVPGSRHAKRWQDVAELLAAGVDVLSTLNIQHLESVNDVVERITGVKQQETIPDEFVRQADQVELVDMTPEALRRRMAHGNIYAPEKVDAALANYFRVGNLGALRELALLWVADKVDESLQDYMADHGIEGPWETRERVVVALTGAPSSEHLIRRAARMAMRSKAELLGVHISVGDGLAAAPSDLLLQHRRLLEDLGGAYHEVVGADVATTLLSFARSQHATQIVLGASRRSRWAELSRGSVINAVVRASGPIDVHVISQEDADGELPPLPRARSATLSLRRQLAGLALALAGVPLLTLLLANTREVFDLPADMLVYLLLVVAVATVGGAIPAVLCAVTGSLALNWFFTPPLYTFTIDKGENAFALVVFITVAVIISALVSQAARRRADAARATAEAEALARVTGGLVSGEDPLAGTVDRLRSTFSLDAVAVLVPGPDADTWVVDASAGSPVPTRPTGDGSTIALGDGAALVLVGDRLREDDLRVLDAFAAQLHAALERRALAAEAAEAGALAHTDQLRTALLRAVSHDLRTPLASIKASATSLLQEDVDWSPAAVREFLVTIDEEADRLNSLVGNLLDMSRLETGALDLLVRPVGLEEVVAAALSSLGAIAAEVTVDVPETLPRVAADPALLERAVANVIGNAVQASPAGAEVRVQAGAVGDSVDLRVIDQGPGVAPELREVMFLPFQRLGDQPNGSGVGLGLAVAHGFLDAMGGALVADDTPGGGLTMVLSLPIAASVTAVGVEGPS